MLAGRIFAVTGAGSPIEGALLYLLSISVWFSALFDFHFEHLIFPIFFLGVLASRRRGIVAHLTALTCGVFLCMVKEPYALMASGFGFYLILNRRWYFTGLLLIAVSVVYFLTVTQVIIPYYSGGQLSGALWSRAYGYLGNSVSDMILTIFSDPMRPIEAAMSSRKVLYVLALGGAFGFVFVRAPTAIVPALPILALSLLSLNPNHSYLGNQYSVGVMAPLFAASANALGMASTEFRLLMKRVALCCSLIILVLFGPAPISRLFVQDATYSFGASAYLPTQRDGWVQRTIEQIVPADPRVVVSTQNSLVTRRLAVRFDLVAFPEGILSPFNSLESSKSGVFESVLAALSDSKGEAGVVKRTADWVVIDRKRATYLKDQDCGWRYGVCADVDVQWRFNDLVANLDASFEKIFSMDGLEIYKRRVTTSGHTLPKSGLCPQPCIASP